MHKMHRIGIALYRVIPILIQPVSADFDFAIFLGHPTGHVGGGARHELEAMRVTPAWNEVWVDRNVEAGLTFQPFNEELMTRMKNVAVMEQVIPGFINRMGGGDAEIIQPFNEKVAHLVGLRINQDGSTEPVPITE